MDRLVYIAMVGAQQAFERQAVTAHNLANANTAGYKSETAAFRTLSVQGVGHATRAYAVAASTGADLSHGTIQRTGRDLDIAVQGDGFIAVQARDGNEAYTRDGSLDVDADGVLTTRGGMPVQGEGGPIVVPQDSTIAIGRDGTVSATSNGQSLANVTVIGKIKLVNPPREELTKGADGLFRTRSGGADADADVAIVSGALEGSNVNAVASMVDMINLARHFDVQMKLLQNAEGNAQRATQLLATNGS